MHGICLDGIPGGYGCGSLVPEALLNYKFIDVPGGNAIAA
jgi:hypothetical protein